MQTQNQNLKYWMPRAIEKGATHILDVVDSFSYDHYPVFVTPGENLEEIKEKFNNKDMQSVYEVIKVEVENG